MHRLPPLLDAVGADYMVIGPSHEEFEDIGPIDDATEHSLVFLSKINDRSLSRLTSTRARIALVDRAWGLANRAAIEKLALCAYLVDKPRLVVSRIMRCLRAPDPGAARIHPTAVVSTEARLHPTVSIGAYCVVGRAGIDADSVVMPFTMIHDGVEVGKRVIIHEHCSIGGSGFGFEQNEDGVWEPLPQIGTVTIEDDVELFPYVNVDRGTFGHTTVGRGTKVDHYGHIGHNTTVGQNCIITAGVVTCGSTTVGDGVWMGVGSIVRQGVHVGSRSTVGLGSVLLKNVDEGDVVAGVPARSLRSRKDGN